MTSRMIKTPHLGVSAKIEKPRPRLRRRRAGCAASFRWSPPKTKKSAAASAAARGEGARGCARVRACVREGARYCATYRAILRDIARHCAILRDIARYCERSARTMCSTLAVAGPRRTSLCNASHAVAVTCYERARVIASIAQHRRLSHFIAKYRAVSRLRYCEKFPLD